MWEVKEKRLIRLQPESQLDQDVMEKSQWRRMSWFHLVVCNNICRPHIVGPLQSKPHYCHVVTALPILGKTVTATAREGFHLIESLMCL